MAESYVMVMVKRHFTDKADNNKEVCGGNQLVAESVAARWQSEGRLIVEPVAEPETKAESAPVAKLNSARGLLESVQKELDTKK